MTEQRSSFEPPTLGSTSGEPAPLDVGEPSTLADSAAPTESFVAPALSEGESIAGESGVEDALLAEALDGGPAPSEDEAPTEPSEPDENSLEDTVEGRVLEREVMIFEAPPAEVSDLINGVLPPRPIRAILNVRLEPPGALDIQEPAERVSPLELPDRQLTPEEEAAILARLGEQRIQELATEVEAAYEEIRRRMAANEAISTEAYNKLLKAQDILLRRDASKLAQAEYYLELVHAQLERASASEVAAQKYQWRLFGWGFLWSSGFLVVLLLMGTQWFQRVIAPSAEGGALLDTETFLASMLWGGIGGAVAVLYSLFKHVGQRDFDSQYVLSYVGKPFLGLVVGATVYMVFNLVIRALGIFPAGIQDAEGNVTPTLAPGVVYLVAWASGFKEDRILELVDRMMKRVFAAVGSDSAQQGDSALLGD